MTSNQDRERMMEEVAGESLPAGFREAALDQTLHFVRRRRQYRVLKRAGTLAAVFAIGFVYWVIHQRPPAREPSASVYEVVQTKAFPATAIIRSKPLRPDQLVTVVFTVDEIHTRKNGLDYRNITDDELLALVASRSGLLLRVGPRDQKLIFPNDDGQRGFPID